MTDAEALRAELKEREGITEALKITLAVLVGVAVFAGLLFAFTGGLR